MRPEADQATRASSAECDLTEPRQFNLMFETTVGRWRRQARSRVSPPGDGAGDLHQLQERAPARAATAAVRDRAGRQVVPQRDHARATSSSASASSSRWRWSSSSRRRRPSSGTATGSTRGSSGTSSYGLRRAGCACGEHGPEERSHYSQGTSDIEYDVPDRLVGARGGREPGRLRPHAPHRVLQHEARVRRPGGRRAVRPLRDRAGGRRSSGSSSRCSSTRTTRRSVAGRERTVLRLHPQIAPVKAAVLPLIAKDGGMVGKARGAVRGAARGLHGRVRRRRRDRPPLPPPGRDRHAVRVHDRRADARGRDGDDPRPGLARAGADRDRPGSRTPGESCASPGRRPRATDRAARGSWRLPPSV